MSASNHISAPAAGVEAGRSRQAYLAIKGLSKTYGQDLVVNNLSLEVAQGELVCLLGSSGCGKTTTLSMLGGFVAPNSGSITLDGEDITHVAPEKRPVSTVFQDYALFPHLTAEENVAYGLACHGVGKQERLTRARAMLEDVHMLEYAASLPAALSGGQQQRVALARSLIMEPKLLLLDEPLCNLDAGLRQAMREEIKRLQVERGITMLFVTHDQQEAMALADRIAIMHNGCLEQVAAPEELYLHPATPYVANFMGHVNRLVVNGEALLFREEDAVIDAASPLTGVVTFAAFLGTHRQYVIEMDEKCSEIGPPGDPAGEAATAPGSAPASTPSIHLSTGNNQRLSVGERVGVRIVRTVLKGAV
jgi:iron(III) transport system ATP-binding protein